MLKNPEYQEKTDTFKENVSNSLKKAPVKSWTQNLLVPS